LFILIADIVALWVLHDDVIQHFFPERVRVLAKLPDWRGYISGPFGNTSHLGDFLALALIPTLILFGQARSATLRAFAFESAIIIPAGLIPCWSVGSKLGLIAGALVMLLVVWRTRRLDWFTAAPRRWIALGAAWALVVAFFLLPHPLNPHPGGIWHEAFASGRWHEGGPTRLAIWAQTLEMLRLHPILGVGAGNFTYIFPRMDSSLLWDSDLRLYQGMWTNAAHNETLQAWAELGFPGLLFLALIFVFAFWSLGRGLKQAAPAEAFARIGLIGLWVAFLFQSQMNFTLQHPPGLWTFGMLILGTLLELRSRVPNIMPPLRAEFGIFALRVDWLEMNRPHTAGLALNLPLPAALPIGIVLIAFAAATIPLQLRPVQAQAAFKRAMQYRAVSPPQADQWFTETLDRWPGLAEARNQYARFLIEQGRPADALEQIERARPRLDIYDFFAMETQAYQQLGQPAAAAEAHAKLQDRLFRARNPQ
jgi:O-antigen ligase